ncbi:MAG: hypothetical protein RPT12_16485 [Vibrio anguillarum]|uniref:hypothetical protein n=1 Tax=Vibrio TaxID=662 RepID=UPI001481FBA1|nr:MULTISPECIES: hypothetical protein [Vibrio]MCX9559636.1 hypothetical protein [Vibrio cholerae]MCX9561261.1 hypothetical protein [Vibrio cholerae]MDT3848513.1 hypothetical protein [Vibrio anguillarum]NNN99440.1 hypothetical protein [Vibrio sp. B1-2]
MSKKEQTLLALDAALHRLIQGKPKRVLVTRKLSIRAIEEEANLGNGSGYYYPEFVEKVKQIKRKQTRKEKSTNKSDNQRLHETLKNEKRIKEKYRSAMEQLTLQVHQMAAEHHHLNDLLRKALSRTEELERFNQELKDQLVSLRRSTITSINSRNT